MIYFSATVKANERLKVLFPDVFRDPVFEYGVFKYLLPTNSLTDEDLSVIHMTFKKIEIYIQRQASIEDIEYIVMLRKLEIDNYLSR